MDSSLLALCQSIKKIIASLHARNNNLSFLLLIGMDGQGKNTLLRQSHYEYTEIVAERMAGIFYNQQGIIVALGESWLHQSKNLLQYTLRQLNRCNKALKISGIILCIDINHLLNLDPIEFTARSKCHTQLLTRFGNSLSYRVDAAIIFTKLDAVAGFCEFFNSEHTSDLKKPLGFSLDWSKREDLWFSNFKIKFEQLIESITQRVIEKIHPVRSSIRRMLIREFPLQLSSLQGSMQALIQTISPQLFHLQAIYFSSAEQGGLSVDCLHKKIQHEYALTIQGTMPQSMNHRAYFIEGALYAFQAHTRCYAPSTTITYKLITGFSVALVAIAVLWFGISHFKSAELLDQAQLELSKYDALKQKNSSSALTIYQLSKALKILEKTTANPLYLSATIKLRTQLSLHAKHQLQRNFIPEVLAQVEQLLVDNRQTQVARYQALRIYLMLGDPSRMITSEVLAWFSRQDHTLSRSDLTKKLDLLSKVLQQPFQALAINHQIVDDTRNYLNALPANYLYYLLAKDEFFEETKILKIEGFDLYTKDLPIYFTKSGFKQTIAQLPAISTKLQADNWVLMRPDLKQLQELLQQAYCGEYALWWQNFMHKSMPLHPKDYKKAQQLTDLLRQHKSIDKLAQLIQQETSPDTGAYAVLFNQEIASKFTDINLISHSAIRHMTASIAELEQFLKILAIVNDQGKTAFNLAKSRFEGESLANPLSALYTTAHQLPEPLSLWGNKIADDTWFILMNDTRNYINQQWLQSVVTDYKATIAHRYPFDANQTLEVAITDFNRFFSHHGVLNNFIELYLKPFLDTSQPQWQLRELNHYVLPIPVAMINELIRANVISNMFFPEQSDTSKIEFSLQKLSLDPVVTKLQLSIGDLKLTDTQDSENLVNFNWPAEHANLILSSIEGRDYELAERGSWAFFKMLQKINVLVDEQDSSSLQILFELNGNSGRYILKTQYQINPFMPGILNGFALQDLIA